MLLVISLYAVAADHDTAAAFIRTVQEGRMLSRRVAPALVGTDLLESRSSAAPPFFSRGLRLFVCLDFWQSSEAFHRAIKNPCCEALFRARRHTAKSSFQFGAFDYVTPVEAEAPLPVSTSSC